MGSDVSSMFVELPVDEPGLAERVERIRESSNEMKALEVADGAAMWARATSIVPTTVLKMASRVQFRGLMAVGNLLVSNVRGPSEPIYCLGGEVREFTPYFGVQDGVGLNIVLFSYKDQLQIGISSDPELLPEIGEFGEMLRKSFGELARVL